MSIQNNMKQLTVKTEKKNKFFITALLISAAVHTVLFCINLYCGNIHIDEAMTIVNARSLADYSTDIMGERLPVYFDTWLYGGQSPFATYLLAVFFKIFGYSLFISRLPMLIFCIGSLVFFYGFLKELFPENEKFINVVFLFAAFSPWQLDTSMYTLDCNFMPHILMIAFYFLAKAINTKQTKFYIASMIFFGIGFYCYILSALIIPLFLLLIYAMLILSRKISLKSTVISVLTIFIIGTPFILFGLVQLKVIDEFTLFGFSYSYMPYYTREAGVNTNNILSNILSGSTVFLFPDFYAHFNKLSYTNAFGGLLTLLGLFTVAAKIFLKRKSKKISVSAIFIIASVLSGAIVCALSFSIISLYRFFSYNYILYIVMGYGVFYLLHLLRKLKLKVLVSFFLCCSLFVTALCLYNIYSPSNILNSYFYIDSIEECLDEAKEKGFESVCVPIAYYDNKNENKSLAVYYNERAIVSLVFYDYDNIRNYNSIETALLSTGVVSYGNITNDFDLKKDKSIYMKYIYKVSEEDNCLIFPSEFQDDLNLNENEYTVSSHGKYTVMYKTSK